MLPVLSARAQQQNLQKKAFDVIGDIAGGAYHSTKNFWMAAIAGGFAGTVMFPVDTAKVRMQACAQSEAAIAASARTYRNAFQTIGKVASDEGIVSLYKGLLPVILGSAPEMAVQVASYEWSRDLIAEKTRQNPLSPNVLFAAGCFSGLTHCLVSNPMEVLKIRGQILGAAGGGLVSAIKELGVAGLYKGVGACWARDIPFSALYFPTYAISKKYLEDQGFNPFACSLGAGLFAGVVGAAPTTPCDVVKTRLQSPQSAGVVYTGVRHCVTRMAAEEGVSSFFVGIVPRVGRVAPYLALSLTSYEMIKAGLITMEKKVAEGSLFPHLGGKANPKVKTGKGKK